MQMSFELLEYIQRPKAERQMIMDELKHYAEQCEKCPELVKSRALYPFGKPTFGYGDINSPLFFIGEAPGMYGCGTTGIPFTKDKSGEYFTKMLREALGLTHDDIWITNAVKCCPENNRTPTEVERSNCLQFLATELKLVKPFVVVTMGMSATKMFFPGLEQFFKVHGRNMTLGDEVGGISGIPWFKLCQHKAFILPIWHPSFVMRDTTHLEQRYRREFKAIERLLNYAYSLWGRPQKGIEVI